MGEIKKQSISSAIISYIGVAIGFLATAIVMPKLFTTSEIGIYKVVLSVSGLFAAIFSLGISQIIVKSYYEYVSTLKSYNAYLRFVLRNLTISSFLVAPFFFLTTDYTLDTPNSSLDYTKSVEFLVLIYALIVGRIYFIGFDALLRIRKKVVTSVIIQNGVLKLYPLFVYLLYYLKLIDFETSILFYVSIYFVLPFVGWYLLRQSKFEEIKNIDVETVKSNRLKLGLFGTLTIIGSASVLFLDTIMVNNILDEQSTGIYAVMFMFGMVVSIPSRPLRSISQSLISNAFAKNEINKVKEIYVKSCRALFVIGSLILLVIICWIPVLLDFLDPEYAVGLNVVYFIGLGYLIDMSTGVNSEVIAASKYYWLGTPLTLLLMILTITTNIILIPVYGISGAAMATFFTLLISNLIKILIILKLFKTQPFNGRYLIGILAFGLIFYLQTNYAFVRDIWLNSLFETIAYGIFMLFLFYNLRVSSDVNGMINRIVYRVFKINLTKD